MHRASHLALVLVSCALALGLASRLEAAPPAAAADSALKSDSDKLFYALGLVMARNVAPFHMSAAELEVMTQGLNDGVLGQPPKVELEEYGPRLKELAETRSKAAASVEMAAAEEFLKKSAADPAVVRTDSGLLFKETAPGSGAHPGPRDTVKVNYHGTLRDGSVFDSTLDKAPAQFKLNRVIPCWTEALQRMRAGGKAHIVCPASIAYGERGAPPKIAPGAALAFDVELLEITPEKKTEP